jgi:hypothetical protein
VTVILKEEIREIGHHRMERSVRLSWRSEYVKRPESCYSWWWCWHARVNLNLVGFEVLTAAVMKIIIFWDITPCSPLKVNWRFGRTFRLLLQGRGISQSRNQREAGGKQSSPCHLLHAWLIFPPSRWRRYVPPKRRLTSNRLHGVISQKIDLFNLNLA